MEEFKKTPRSLSYRGEALEQIPLTGTTSVPEGGAHPQKRRSGSLIRGFSVLLFAAALAGALAAAALRRLFCGKRPAPSGGALAPALVLAAAFLGRFLLFDALRAAGWLYGF